MTPIDPNAQAFPRGESQDGLTIRAEFAKAAMQGMLSSGYSSFETAFAQVAVHAVKQADALIVALNQPKTP